MVSMCGLLRSLLLGLQFQNALAHQKPLRGVHLRLLPIEAPEVLYVERDVNRTITGVAGRSYHVIDWLSRDLGFTYSFANIENVTTVVNTTTARGGMSYLLSGEVDIILGFFYLSDDRSAVMDLAFPSTVTSFLLMTPLVDSSNIGAPWRPFQHQIWLSILCCLLLVPLFLHLMVSLLRMAKLRKAATRSKSEHLIDKSSEYVLKVLLHQGGAGSSGKLAVTWIKGAWCLSCFVLIAGYSSTLISFLTASTKRPLVTSLYDLLNKPDVHVVVEESTAADFAFSKGESGILKFIGQDLNRNPHLRCTRVTDCVERVKAGHHVYVNTASLILFHMSDDFKRTGKCSLAISKESFINVLASLYVSKNNPATRRLDEGLIRLWETGLLGLWRRRYMKVPEKCLGRTKKKGHNRPIKIDSLVSAFVVLLIGYGAAAVAFVVEFNLHRLAAACT